MVNNVVRFITAKTTIAQTIQSVFIFCFHPVSDYSFESISTDSIATSSIRASSTGIAYSMSDRFVDVTY